MNSEYEKYSAKIDALCEKYGFTHCDKCPLFWACCDARKDTETESEYTERIEKALVKAYKEKVEKEQQQQGNTQA